MPGAAAEAAAASSTEVSDREAHKKVAHDRAAADQRPTVEGPYSEQQRIASLEHELSDLQNQFVQAEAALAAARAERKDIEARINYSVRLPPPNARTVPNCGCRSWVWCPPTHKPPL